MGDRQQCGLGGDGGGSWSCVQHNAGWKAETRRLKQVVTEGCKKVVISRIKY